MALYKYRAKKGPQGVTEGTVEAYSHDEAVDKISQMGFFPISVEEFRQGQSMAQPVSVAPSRIKARSSDITIFSRQLASLLRSGVPILNSLSIIAEQSESQGMKDVLHSVRNAVKDGGSFSSSLVKYPNVFSHLYVAMVRAGEDSGNLPEVLLRVADHRMRQEEMISRFRMALSYPILMMLVGCATIIFMLTYVMPRLMKIFSNLGQSLPMPTRILISMSDGLREWWFWICLVSAIIILLIRREVKTKTGKLSLSLFALHLPIFGKFILKAEISRFCRTLELLTRSGIPILKAINVTIPVLENEIIKEHLRKSYQELEQGGSLGRSLKDSKLFPPFMTNLIIVGEESGKLDEALGEVATSYERDTDETMRVMASLLEPLMILVMGLIVGFIVIAMLLPIFEINVMAR